MADNDGERAWMTSASCGVGKRRYHTDPDCEGLQRAERVLEKPLEAVEGYFHKCRYCEGDVPTPGSPTQSTISTDLAKMSPEDIGLSPLDEEAQAASKGWSR